ncbi:MAG: hypothetical protein SGI84_01300 [Gemmatimonadota bacterium]|nr:hypothetical protein [Gemmatimonadota bacterium]
MKSRGCRAAALEASRSRWCSGWPVTVAMEATLYWAWLQDQRRAVGLAYSVAADQGRWAAREGTGA